MTLTEHNLEINGKLTLDTKIARNQGVTMNIYKCDQGFYGEGDGGKKENWLFMS